MYKKRSCNTRVKVVGKCNIWCLWFTTRALKHTKHTHTHRAESPPQWNPVFESIGHFDFSFISVIVNARWFTSVHLFLLSEQAWCQISLFFFPLSLSLHLSPPQSQGSPYSMSGQRNVRALWANCKGEGRQNQVCVSQPVWYIQRKEPWNTKACWWVSRLSHPQKLLCFNITTLLSHPL